MRTVILAAVLALVAGPLGAAQLYRWVDEKGNVEWRDTPPPATAKKVEQRSVRGNVIETSEAPYATQQAARNFPVTLWTSDCGPPCDQGRTFLARRGVPYTERDAQRDVEAFKKMTGGIDVPVLYVGRTRLKGYAESEWEAALDNAGYPRTAITAGGKLVTKDAQVAKPPATATPPVVLYTHPGCGPACAEARSLLAERGITFREVVAQEPAAIDELERVSGDSRVPVLAIGKSVTRGFHPPGYHSVLDTAGFPRGQPADRK